MNETFTPKIVRWGQRYGGKNEKKGMHIMAYQKGVGSNNSTPRRKRHQGRIYRNLKRDRISRNFAGIA